MFIWTPVKEPAVPPWKTNHSLTFDEFLFIRCKQANKPTLLLTLSAPPSPVIKNEDEFPTLHPRWILTSWCAGWSSWGSTNKILWMKCTRPSTELCPFSLESVKWGSQDTGACSLNSKKDGITCHEIYPCNWPNIECLDFSFILHFFLLWWNVVGH